MALDVTVGGASSDSYGTQAAFQAYVVANIDAAYSGVVATNEVNLRRATQYLDRKYRFVGYQQYETQALAWPRLTSALVDGWSIDPDTVPQDIIDAQFELAYTIEVDGIDPFATLTTGAVTRTMSKAGPVSTETEYDAGRSTPRIVAVDGLLAPYVTSAPGAQIRYLRA